jgi:Spy/CpxP family protein refolding chaperone
LFIDGRTDLADLVREVTGLNRKLAIVSALTALLTVLVMARLVSAEAMAHGGRTAQSHMMDADGMMGADDMMGPGGMMGRGKMMFGRSPLPVFLRSADLTPTQQAKVKKILLNNRASLHDQFKQMHAARKQIAAKLFSSGPVTAADLTPETEQIAKVRQQMLQNELKVALEVRAILTPAQLQKVAQFHEKFESLKEQMRAMMAHGGPPPPLDEPAP